MYVPWAGVTVTTASQAPTSLHWGEMGLTVGYNLFPGLRADLSYTPSV